MNNINLSMLLLAIGMLLHKPLLNSSKWLLIRFGGFSGEFIEKEGERAERRQFRFRMTAGILFSLTGYSHGWSQGIISPLILVTVLLLGLYADYMVMIVPRELLLVGGGLIGLMKIMEKDRFVFFLLSCLALYFLLYLIHIATGGRFGGADVRMFGLIGMTYGWNAGVNILYMACIVGIVYALWKKWGEKGVGKEFAFYPSIVMAVMLHTAIQT